MEKKLNDPMETNNIFSFKRFILLCKQSLIINKKLIGISLAGFSGFVFLLLYLFQKKSFQSWDNASYTRMLLYLFFTIGTIYSSLSFPAFRMKEKSITYLMLPASISEKFTFELLIRVVMFILLMPVLYWAVANIEGTIVHHFKPEFQNYKFSLIDGWSKILHDTGDFKLRKIFFIQYPLFIFTVMFAGACHFSKSPLLKTLFTISIIMVGYAVLIYILTKGFNVRGYIAREGSVFFDEPLTVYAISSIVASLCLLAVTFFKLKEKEA